MLTELTLGSTEGVMPKSSETDDNGDMALRLKGLPQGDTIPRQLFFIDQFASKSRNDDMGQICLQASIDLDSVIMLQVMSLTFAI